MEWIEQMTRGSSEILPICPYCGHYKGIGDCQNPDCHRIYHDSRISAKDTECVICSSEGAVSCSVCNHMYCNEHSEGMNQTKITTIDQHIGTCIICGKFVCEQCWIFNKEGKITCLIHVSPRIG